MAKWLEESKAYAAVTSDKTGAPGAPGTPIVNGAAVITGANAHGMSSPMAPPLLILDPSKVPATNPSSYAKKLEEEVKKGKDEMRRQMESEMEKRLQDELKKASAANQAAVTAAAEAAEEKLRRMHQEFSRQMQARVQQNEQNVKSIKD